MLDCYWLVMAKIKKNRKVDTGEKIVRSGYFTGAVSNVAQYMSAMDVFLMPSQWEGLPVVLVEAQANGLPCIISDVITDR